MNKNIFVTIIVLAVIGLGAAFLIPDKKVIEPQNATYTNPELGIEFDYPAGPDGYIVTEAIPGSINPDLFRILVIMSEKDAANTPPENGEYPPSMSVTIFKNSANESSANWVEAHPVDSNISLKQGDTTETVVGGESAVRYTTDGLYMADTVVVAHGGFVYVMRGEYFDIDSNLHADFVALVDSVRFIPTDAQSSAGDAAKIDIVAVCQSALAYMTFPDGAAADAFVEACIAGEHPEVIERWKKDNGISDDAVL